VVHAATALVKLEPLATILALLLNQNLLLLLNLQLDLLKSCALSAHTKKKNVVDQHEEIAIDKLEIVNVSMDGKEGLAEEEKEKPQLLPMEFVLPLELLNLQ
jgi:hypothetical protein